MATITDKKADCAVCQDLETDGPFELCREHSGYDDDREIEERSSPWILHHETGGNKIEERFWWLDEDVQGPIPWRL